ncbi:MAG: hypothetical protein WC612_08215 [Bdellovibrionales bacterium]|jgi:hypothetical protein
MTSSVQKWLEDMKTIWLEKKPDLIAAILATKLEYYENPFEPPLTSIESVVSAWQGIKNQNIEYVEIEILHESPEGIGTAIWKFKERNSTEHIGCYFLKLDKKGKCSYFRQFWNSR